MDEQNQEDRAAEASQEARTPEKKQTGSVIGSIIVIIVIIVGGLYFWGTRTTAPVEEGVTPPEIPMADPIGDALRNTSDSDELNAIEADLDATDINGIDAGVNAI